MTKFCTWSDEYRLGNKVLDRQHMYLFDILNTLHEGQKDIHVQKKCFDELKKYAQKHFITEEETMRVYGFPIMELERHQKEHQNFARKIDDFCKVIEDESTVVMESVMVYLKNWLSNHVLKSDRELIKYLTDTSP